MLNRLYLSRPLAFLFKEGSDAIKLSGINSKLSGMLMRKSGQSVMYTANRFLWSNSSILCRNVSLLARPKTVPYALGVRLYQKGSTHVNKSWKTRVFIVVRGVLMTTGSFVWLVALLAYLSLDKVTVDVLEDEHDAAASSLQSKLAEHFYKEENETEILKKKNALDSVWQKLSQEEQIKAIFGEPVFICGYKYKFMNEDWRKFANEMDGRKTEGEVERQSEVLENNAETASGLTWEPECYIEGPKKLGVMNVKFKKHEEEWIPVSLHLETLEKTGHVVSKVSGLLPNGIKNFTRLSN